MDWGINGIHGASERSWQWTGGNSFFVFFRFLKKDKNMVENVSEELSLGFLHEFCLCVCVCGLEMRIVSLNWIFRVFITGSARVVWNLDWWKVEMDSEKGSWYDVIEYINFITFKVLDFLQDHYFSLIFVLL